MLYKFSSLYNYRDSIHYRDSFTATIVIVKFLLSLSTSRHAAAIGLLCKLLDETCHTYLQRFCPSFLSSISLLRRSQRLNTLQPFLSASFITATVRTSLDLFRRSFLGCYWDLEQHKIG